MALDRAETATALLVLTAVVGLFLADPVPDDRLWIVLPVVVLFAASAFVIGVLYGTTRGKTA